MSTYSHKPVMPQEVLSLFNLRTGLNYIDGTTGGAGHSRMILDILGDSGHLYSFDQDEEVINRLLGHSLKNWTLVNENFSEIYNYCKENQIEINGGILLDLGLSSIQLDDPERALNFDSEYEPDMRLDRRLSLTASQVINKYQEKVLADIIYQYGEENKSRQVAKAIVGARPIRSCRQLAELIKGLFIKSAHGKTFRIHPATKTFQALRIFVNRELDVLEKVLKPDLEVLKPGSIIVVISFHSLEDRIVKNAFRSLKAAGKAKILTPKPLIASEEEITENPRSRSAKLRAIEIL